jgi:hypothetical protein
MKTNDDFAWIDQSLITAGDSSKLEGKSAADFVNDVSVS